MTGLFSVWPEGGMLLESVRIVMGNVVAAQCVIKGGRGGEMGRVGRVHIGLMNHVAVR